MRRLNSNLANKPNDDDHKTPYLEIIIVGAIQVSLSKFTLITSTIKQLTN